jgi:UDP-3-O-[3-hydroxymyristoyl] glucosamine N-acyltransferase
MTPIESPAPAQLFPRALHDLAYLVSGDVVGNSDLVITGIADVEAAGAGDLVFAESTRYLYAGLRSRAAAVLVSANLLSTDVMDDKAPQKPIIVVENARAAFIQLLEMLAPQALPHADIHETAHIGALARLGTDVSVGCHVSIGAGTVLGDRVVLMPGVRIAEHCFIDDDTVLYPNVVIYAEVRIGKRCILHAGCVIGADGFGYVPVGGRARKVPHVGTVEIGDDVEVGANTCIDRAKTGVTVIGAGTKIDNLVHIAHNVHIGQSCLIIAQVGIAGSVTVGNGVILAGQSGVKDHVNIGDGVRVGARGGVIGDVSAGETVSGFPARPHREKMRELAASAALPETHKRVRELEQRLAALERKYAK